MTTKEREAIYNAFNAIFNELVGMTDINHLITLDKNLAKALKIKKSKKEKKKS